MQTPRRICQLASAFSDYGVKQTPWRNGKGDVVRDFTEACRKEGLAVGLYYSPAQFGSRQTDEGSYNAYFISQITELLSGYGKIDYLWFDACGSGDFQYDADRIVKTIRSLQPEILIFNLWDPDTRWIGNESGLAGLGYRNTIGSFDPVTGAVGPGDGKNKVFLPAECDVCLRGHDWFYSENNEDKMKSVKELLGLYEHSVGRGANLLLNIGPDRRGLLPDADVKCLAEFGQALRARFADGKVSDLRQETIKGSGGRVILSLEWECPCLISGAVLREDLTRGEHIRNFSLRVYPKEGSVGPVEVYMGKGVGHKHIASFPPVVTLRAHVVVERSDGVPVFGPADILQA
jgi:alpha-L-fucosidase